MNDSRLLQTFAHRLSGLFSDLPAVEAVVLGGSHSAGLADAGSDLDLYVYSRSDVPLASRRSIVEVFGGASRADLGMTFWGPSDAWFDATSGIEVDVTYFDVDWIERQIDSVVREHIASLGYSTCLWHAVRHSQILRDPRGWFEGLHLHCQLDYPEELRRNIVALNHSVLRNVVPSYLSQLRKALLRNDMVSVNHRLAGLLASYFDVIFALNRLLHPGEKRLVAFSLENCERLPIEMAADINSVLQVRRASVTLLNEVERLIDRLDHLLAIEGFDANTSLPLTT